MPMSDLFAPRIAVILPCYNEAATIAQVIADFRLYLPAADIFVFDNNSSDDTGRIAAAAGAQVLTVPMPGKGNVVRRMFADIEADVYVMTDGDATYSIADAPRMVDRLLSERLEGSEAYRFGHRFGNRMLTRCVAVLFGRTFSDMLSGYRVFSRRYVKSFPAHSTGFEIETELTVHALELRMPVAEMVTAYGARPVGSQSKLRTYRDGIRILTTIVRLFKAEKPLIFFSLGSVATTLLAIVLAVPLLETYAETGLVPRQPTALLCVALVLLGGILFACGRWCCWLCRGC